MGSKVCTKCGIDKPLAVYHKEKRAKDGRKSACNICYREQINNWRNNNKEYHKNWHKKNPDYRRTQYEVNKEKELLNNKKWRQRNSAWVRKKAGKRRQLENDLPYHYNEDDWKDTLLYFRHMCAYCGKESDKLQRDHFIPVIKGGPYIKSNIIPACHPCNSGKRHFEFIEWYKKQTFYSKERKELIYKFIGVKNKLQQLSIL